MSELQIESFNPILHIEIKLSIPIFVKQMQSVLSLLRMNFNDRTPAAPFQDHLLSTSQLPTQFGQHFPGLERCPSSNSRYQHSKLSTPRTNSGSNQIESQTMASRAPIINQREVSLGFRMWFRLPCPSPFSSPLHYSRIHMFKSTQQHQRRHQRASDDFISASSSEAAGQSLSGIHASPPDPERSQKLQ